MSVHEREDRALRLQRVAELLAEAVTPQEVLDAILTEGVRAAEARAGAIGVLSPDRENIELLARGGLYAELYRTYRDLITRYVWVRAHDRQVQWRGGCDRT